MVYRTNYKGYRLETHVDLIGGNVNKLYLLYKGSEFIQSFVELSSIEKFIKNNGWLIDRVAP